MAASRVKLTLTNTTYQDLYNHYNITPDPLLYNGQTFHRYSWRHGHLTCVLLYTAPCSELPQYLKQELEKLVAEIGNWEAMCMYTKLFSMDFVTL